MKRSLALLLSLPLLLPLWPACAADTTEEDQQIAVLQSGQSPREKDAACARLKWIGTPRSVPALSALLADDALSHSARYALESMPGPEAGQALLKALPKTSGSNAVGIVNSLAFRRETAAVPALGALLSNSNLPLASAAAVGLGRIGGPQALKLLQAAAPASSGPLHGAEIDGLLACANTLLTAGDTAEAAKIFQQLYDREKSDATRLAAFRGLILASGDKGISHMAAAIAGADASSQGAALQVAAKIPGPAATAALAALLPTVDLPVQIALLQCLALRGDPSAADAVAPLADSSNPDVRLAAITALGDLGGQSVALSLAQKAASATGAERDAARQSLVDLRHGPVTEALLNLLAGASPEVRLEAIRALGQRGDPSAVPQILQLAQSQNDPSAAPALQALALLGGPAQIPDLVKLVVSAANDDSRSAAADALGSISQRYGAENGKWDVKVLAQAALSAPLQARLALLPVCGGLTAAPLRDALRASMQDSDPQVREAALRALSETRNPDLLPDLLNVACGTGEKKSRVLAVRGCVRLATHEDSVKLSNAQKVETLKKLIDTSLDDPEKRIVLSGLASIPDDQALALAVPMLDEDAVRSEAAQAVIHIAGSIAAARPAEAGAALKKVLAMQITPATRKSAEAAFKKIQ